MSQNTAPHKPCIACKHHHNPDCASPCHEATCLPGCPKCVAKVFYVTIQRDSRVKVLAGPFATFADADAQVDPARKHAEATVPFAGFDAFGVTGVTHHPDSALPSCPFNEPLGVTPVPAR